jgi:light-regulated signal transduction histidine kinase (bacteriophytochrome)
VYWRRYSERRTEFEDAPGKENQKFVLTNHYKFVMLKRQTRAAEHLPLFSDRSYRAEPSRGSDGAGLGLALAKSILELHGRSVTIQSKAGRGTTSQTEIPVSIGTHCFCAALVA